MASAVRLAVTARCQRCDWAPSGDADKGAERHTKATGHATAVVAVPVKAVTR